jgi:hypothetical protein
MSEDPRVSTATKVTTVCAVAGLTAWSLVGEVAPNDLFEAVALLGSGVVLPVAVTEARRRRD